VSGWRLFYTLNGPAGLQLDTDSNSVPNQLGIIAGNKTDNLLLSRLIPGDNDTVRFRSAGRRWPE
jgi:hypothetical protein